MVAIVPTTTERTFIFRVLRQGRIAGLVTGTRSPSSFRCGWQSELLVPMSENANRLTGSLSPPPRLRCNRVGATPRSKAETHLTVLQGRLDQ
jgi:hypothetical protein